MRKFYDFIVADITNICNLRCPYCLNDWTQVGVPNLMDEVTFLKLTSLLPLLNDESSFYFSCLFEPTIHPNMINLLKMIPEPERKKVFFTTNLTFPLSDVTISEFANSGIHHINISLDSFNPQVFKSKRKGANFEVFINNLKRLTKTFEKTSNPPLIHYITVITKDNLKEVPFIIETCQTEYLGALNEIRTFSIHEHMNVDWVDSNKVSYEEYINLRHILSKSPYNWESYYPQLPYKWTTFKEDKTIYEHFYEEIQDPGQKEVYFVPPYASLKVESNGQVSLFHIGKDIRFDLKEIQAPYDFFKNIMTLHTLDVDRSRELQRLTEKNIALTKQKEEIKTSIKTKLKNCINKLKNI